MESTEYQTIVSDAAYTHWHEVGGGILFVALLFVGIWMGIRHQIKRF